MTPQGDNKISQPSRPAITVCIEKGTAEKTDFCFTGTFLIGRSKECDVRLWDEVVSRKHAEVCFESDQWWVKDLQSGNGTLIAGERITRAPLKNGVSIQLGPSGPLLTFSIEQDALEEKTIISGSGDPPVDPLSLTHYKKYYFEGADDEPVGHHTMMIRQAFQQIQKKEKRKYIWIIAGVACLAVAIGAYAIVKHVQIKKQRIIAEDIFYSMKSMELEFADILKAARVAQDEESKKNVESYRARQKGMEEKYDQFVESLNVYGKNTSEQEKLIYKVARIFGECEIDIPDGFTDEVLNYIDKWKATARLKEGIDRANSNGYTTKVTDALKAYNLPPQFFYLALKESGYDIEAVGPETRFGIAKGVWQFIPETAERYGLRVGPLANQRKVDVRDERHHFDRSTLAAAKYLREIYDTEAQASGLLVMAAYNWGENRVIDMIQKLPKNPKDRNFWRILKNNKKKIPQQTYDYVFYIFSAAVIGENPRLFGFDFDNPLRS